MLLSYIQTNIYVMLTNWIKDKGKEKNVIIDPLTCIVKLAVLSFKAPGTKISISKNSILFHEPNFFQGTWRFFQGDKREDLHNLYKPIHFSKSFNEGTSTRILLCIIIETFSPSFRIFHRIWHNVCSLSNKLCLSEHFKSSLPPELMML